MSGREHAAVAQEIGRLRRQIAALCQFGGQSLRARDLDGLLSEAARSVSDAIEIKYVKVLELMPGREELLVRAGTNWEPGIVGHLTLGMASRSPAGYALETDAAVISLDVATEHRFDIPEALTRYGIKSMVNVVIKADREPWGVLEVDAPWHRGFDDDDIAFLQNYANLLAAAIERIRADRALAHAAERGQMLLAESRHRVRNLLLNVQALARRTGAASDSLDAFKAAFETRLAALGRSQDLLTIGPGGGVDIGEALGRELDAHGVRADARVALDGPELALAPEQAQALGMAFHELLTNAAKHGALARAAGKLSVTWKAVGAPPRDEVLVRWRETGLTIPEAPRRRGVGSETLERGLPFMLGGKVELAYHPDGLECTIRFPRRGRSPEAGATPPA